MTRSTGLRVTAKLKRKSNPVTDKQADRWRKKQQRKRTNG